jgi:Ca2+-binding EF-hand superfamily protein
MHQLTNAAAVSPEDGPSRKATTGVFDSPFASKEDDIEAAKGVSPGDVKLKEEDAEFMKLLKKRSKQGRCHCCKATLCFIPKTILAIASFFCVCTGQAIFLFYAYTMWECLGIPVSKLDKDQYLFSRYLDQKGDVEVMFALLKLDREEQLKWLYAWEAMDGNGDDQMDRDEFNNFLEFSDAKDGTVCWLTDRMFEYYNKEFNGLIKFRDFLTISFTFAPYDRERCIELSFRLLSRRGDSFDIDRSVIDLTDIEHFVRVRYNKNEKKSERWVVKKAVDLYSHIDEDMSGGISYSEFREYALKYKIFLLYGFYFQSQIRKCLFGETYWRDATESRRMMYTLDQPFQEEMMGLLDWQAVVNIGMAPKGAYIDSDTVKKPDFKKDFYDAWFHAKEARFLEKQKADTRADVSVALAAKTHSRMVKIFGRIVPDMMTLATGFAIWKDVNAYMKSMAEDNGESYRVMNMSLVDLNMAAKASSIDKTTEKLTVAMSLGAEFEAEKKQEVKKKESRKEKSAKMAKEVMDSVSKQVISNDDIVSDHILSMQMSSMQMNKSTKHGRVGYKLDQSKTGVHRLPPLDIGMQSKIDRIVRNKHMLGDIQNVTKSVYERKALRLDIHKHFDDIEKGKENWDELSIKSAATDTSRIDGFEGMGDIGTLAALNSVKALANLGRQSMRKGSVQGGRRSSISEGQKGGSSASLLSIR